MRLAAVIAALLFLLSPVASAAPSVVRCTELGCVVLQDRDGDDVYDWGNVAVAVEHAWAADAHLEDRVVSASTSAGTEETLDPYHNVGIAAAVDATGEQPREAWAFAEVYEGDEEDGSVERLTWGAILLEDSDGDGVADHATVLR